MRTFVVTLALAGSLALPSTSQAMEDMTCADFSAMDAHGQMEALSMMEGGAMDAGDAMAAGDTMAAEGTATDEMTKGVAMACAEHPDMMVGEAMKAGN